MDRSSSRHFLRTFRGAVTFALGAAIVGCGTEQKSVVPLFPAIGTVTLDGEPLAGADLEFIPEGETRGQGGAARTSENGSYAARTPFDEPGLAAGVYRVVIRKQEAPPGMKDAPPPDPNLPMTIDSAFVEKLPPIYSDPALTKLSATVTEAGDKPIDFQLKSARKKP